MSTRPISSSGSLSFSAPKNKTPKKKEKLKKVNNPLLREPLISKIEKQRRSHSNIYPRKGSQDNNLPGKISFSKKIASEEKGSQQRELKGGVAPKILFGHFKKPIATAELNKDNALGLLTDLFEKKKNDECAKSLIKWISEAKENIDILANGLSQYEGKHLESDLVQFSSYSELIPLISLYSKKNQPCIESLALKIHDSQMTSSSIMLATIEHFTEFEVQHEREETIFRESSLTVELSRLYLESVLRKALESTCTLLKRSLKRYEPAKICIDPRLISSESLESNMMRFKEFSKKFLMNFYQFSLPSECYQLLEIRKKIVYKQFNLQCSESSVNELLFLRIFNPALYNYTLSLSNPHSKSVVTFLAKILQALASGVLFGEEKKNETLEQLNDLLTIFQEKHRQFLCKNLSK